MLQNHDRNSKTLPAYRPVSRFSPTESGRNAEPETAFTRTMSTQFANYLRNRNTLCLKNRARTPLPWLPPSLGLPVPTHFSQPHSFSAVNGRPSSLLLVLALVLGGCTAQDQGTERPNVLVIVADDLGYMDIGAYNDDTFYETPHIDSLVHHGMMFTDGYAANPVCSPSRYSLMTGRAPSREDHTDWFCGRKRTGLDRGGPGTTSRQSPSPPPCPMTGRSTACRSAPSFSVVTHSIGPGSTRNGKAWWARTRNWKLCGDGTLYRVAEDPEEQHPVAPRRRQHAGGRCP